MGGAATDTDDLVAKFQLGQDDPTEELVCVWPARRARPRFVRTSVEATKQQYNTPSRSHPPFSKTRVLSPFPVPPDTAKHTLERLAPLPVMLLAA